MAIDINLCPGCRRTYTVTGGDFDPDWTIHPGEHWREILEDRGVSQTEAAAGIGISVQYLNNILNGHRVPNAEVTVAFVRYLDLPGAERFLWQLVANYKLDLAMGKKPQ